MRYGVDFPMALLLIDGEDGGEGLGEADAVAGEFENAGAVL